MEYGGTGYNPNEPVCRKSRTARIAVDGMGVNPVANTVRKQKIAGNYIVSNNVFKFNV